MLRVEEEEEPLQKKRQGEEGCEFEEEEEPKRQKVGDEDEHMDEDMDRDFDVDDFDQEKWDGTVETAWGHREKEDQEEEEEAVRNCLKVRPCNKFQHSSKHELVTGEPLFEVFKVTLSLNEKYHKDYSPTNPLKGRLYGAIVMEDFNQDINPPHIPYYWVSKKDAASITLYPGKVVHLPLIGPKPRPPIAWLDWLVLFFALKFNDEDVFEHGFLYKNAEIFDDGDGPKTGHVSVLTYHFPSYRIDGPCISLAPLEPPFTERFIIRSYFSIFSGVWAYVDVKILKKGVSKFYGFIYARPCIFKSRIRLLSIQPDNQKLELQENGYVKLTRSIVAVPSYSSLIIAAVLYDQDGNQIVRGKTFFAASKEGSKLKYIHDKDSVAVLEVAVKWSCANRLDP